MKTAEITGFGLFGRERVHALSHLLPYPLEVKKKERLLAGLKEYFLLLTAIEQTAEALLDKKLQFFDPLVGENACQIRALKLAVVLREKEFDLPFLLSQVQGIKDRLNELKYTAQSDLSLQDVIEQHSLELYLNDSELYLLRAYLLSRVKMIRSSPLTHPLLKNEYTDTKKIKEIGSVGSQFADDLVEKLRQDLSQSSVRFVQKAAEKLLVPDTSLHMISDDFLVVHRGLHCIPCYWMTKILMYLAQAKEMPIVLLAEQVAKDQGHRVIERIALFFEKTKEGYRVTTQESYDTDLPVLIFHGKSCRDTREFPSKEQWTEELLAYNPIDLLLAYAAAHRQYPDESKDMLVSAHLDDEYTYHKETSNKWGCSLDNASLFFLSHAYCDTVRSIPHEFTSSLANA